MTSLNPHGDLRPSSPLVPSSGVTNEMAKPHSSTLSLALYGAPNSVLVTSSDARSP